MVKIDNTYHDIYTGKSGNAIYQRQYGQQIRRRAYKHTIPPTKKQLEARNRFKNAIENIKKLTPTQILNIKKFYKILKDRKPHSYPVNWYNFAKWLHIKKPTYTLLDNSIGKYRIEHVSIERIRELSTPETIVYDSGKLSTPETGNILNTYTHTPTPTTSIIEVTPINGITYNIEIGEPIEGLTFFDIQYFDNKYFA